jgi:hypothetical protein
MPNPNFHEYHDPNFDGHVRAAQSFVTDELRLAGSVPLDKITILNENKHPEFVSKFGLPNTEVAWTFLETGDVIATASPDPQYPEGATSRLVSRTVHELVHLKTADSSEHAFYTEMLAGLGEVKYLERQRKDGRLVRATGLMLDRAGVRLWLPGEYRNYDSSSVRGAHSTQALVAASGFAVSQGASGIGLSELFSAPPHRRTDRYAVAKRSFNTLRRGLAREIETYPQTTDGIIQATALIQDEGRKKGIVPVLP